MNKIYLDNAATTAPDFELLNQSLLFLQNDGFYNPSALYKSARSVKLALEGARQILLKQFPTGYDAIFSSCGSESDNTAIFSFARRGNAITTAGEHAAVFNTFNELKNRGVETRIAPLKWNGAVDVERLITLVDEKTTFVSVMHVNNETGAINDINNIAKRVKNKNPNVIFHSDGVQAFLKIPYIISSDVDLYCVSAHKIKALKGVGALLYKKNLCVKPLVFGGGQEKKLRSGTENIFGIDLFARCINRYSNITENNVRAEQLKKTFLKKIDCPFVLISQDDCSPYIISFSIPGIKAEILQRVLDDDGVIVGTGSACSSKIGVSRVISACVTDKRIAEGTIRVSTSFDTNENDLIKAADIISRNAKKLLTVLK